MARGSSGAMRGSRIGAGPMGEAERGEVAPRRTATYWCHQHHVTTLTYATTEDVVVPPMIDCRRCGAPAGQDMDSPPVPKVTAPYKSHMAYVRERRSQAEGDALVDEALKALRGK